MWNQQGLRSSNKGEGAPEASSLNHPFRTDISQNRYLTLSVQGRKRGRVWSDSGDLIVAYRRALFFLASTHIPRVRYNYPNIYIARLPRAKVHIASILTTCLNHRARSFLSKILLLTPSSYGGTKLIQSNMTNTSRVSEPGQVSLLCH